MNVCLEQFTPLQATTVNDNVDTVIEGWMTAGLIICEHICMSMMIGVCDLRGFSQHLHVATVSAISQQNAHCAVGSVLSTMFKVQCSV